MPAKGSTLRYGNRDYIFSKEVYPEMAKKTKVDLPYATYKKIIETANKNVGRVVVDEIDGFKMPFGLGFLCAVRWVPKTPAIDWDKTRKNGGKHVYHLNLHTFGFSAGTRWFRVSRMNAQFYNQLFKFKACKELAKLVSESFRGGKQYLDLSASDFRELGRLDNLYNKTYRKDLKEK